MLLEKEIKFIEYWENARIKESRFSSKLISGLPTALLFGLPIILFLGIVYFFFPEWYTKVSNISGGTMLTILIAVLIAGMFYSYFKMHFKWEMNEQYFMELLKKKDRNS